MQIYAFLCFRGLKKSPPCIMHDGDLRRRISLLLHHDTADEAVRARTETHDKAALAELVEVHGARHMREGRDRGTLHVEDLDRHA